MNYLKLTIVNFIWDLIGFWCCTVGLDYLLYDKAAHPSNNKDSQAGCFVLGLFIIILISAISVALNLLILKENKIKKPLSSLKFIIPVGVYAIVCIIIPLYVILI